MLRWREAPIHGRSRAVVSGQRSAVGGLGRRSVGLGGGQRSAVSGGRHFPQMS